MKKVGLTAAQSWACVLSCYTMHGESANSAYLAMMKDFRAGRPLPAVGDWKKQWRETHPHTRLPPMCPADWTPRGASFSAIMAARKTLMASSKGNPSMKDLCQKTHQVLRRSEMKKRNGVRVIRASISTVKAGKMMRKVTGCGMYATDAILRDVYLAGARDVIGGDLGWAFRSAILTGDMKQVARFCSDGWKVIGDMEAFASERAALKGIIGIHQSVKQISRNLAAILDDVAKEKK